MEVECGRCGGSGVNPEGGGQCPSCSGTGVVTCCWYQAVQIRQEALETKVDDLANKVNEILVGVNLLVEDLNP